MAHVGEEGALRAVRIVGGILRLVQFLRSLRHEFLQPGAFALGMAQPPPGKPGHRAQQRDRVERDRGCAAVPGQCDAEGEARGFADESIRVDGAHFKSERPTGEIGEHRFVARRRRGPFLPEAEQARLVAHRGTRPVVRRGVAQRDGQVGKWQTQRRAARHWPRVFAGHEAAQDWPPSRAASVGWQRVQLDPCDGGGTFRP